MTALVLLTGLSAAAARWPTGFRLDVAVMAVAGTIGLLPAVLAVVAGAIVSLIRHHDDWHDLVPFAVGAVAAMGTALVLRRPRPLDQLPSRTALRLLVLVAGAAVLGRIEHAVQYAEVGHIDFGHAALTAARLLCGALIATAIAWRPVRRSDAVSLFMAACAATVNVVLIISTIAFWQQQDESLLHSTADAVSTGFLSSLANEINVVSTKAATSTTEAFTPERFPSLMQTVVFGHDSMPAAQLVRVTASGPQVTSGLSSLGGEFEGAFRDWTERADEKVRGSLVDDSLTYLGLASLPRPTDDGSSAYLVYGIPLIAPAGAEDPQVLVVALSVPVMMRASTAPTPASNGEAIVHLNALDGDRYVLLYATDLPGDGTGAASPGTFVAAEPPNDQRGEQALAEVALNDTTFTFSAMPGHDFGTPLGLRRLIIWTEGLAGVLLVGLVLSSGDHLARRERERERREALLSAALEAAPGWTAIVDRDGVVVMSNGHVHGAAQGAHVSTSLLWDGDDAAVVAIGQLLSEARAGTPSVMQYLWSDPGDLSHAIRIFDIQTRPLPDPSLVYLQCTDVTEHRDRAMRTAQSERMEAIGVLAGGLAHDFNNLLFITLGYLQMLERQRMINDDPQARLYVARATEAVERGAVVAKSLLSFARSQPLTAVPVDLGQFMHELQPLIEQALGSAHRLELVADGDDLDVVVDPGRLSSSLLNTVFNARDAMDGPGVVEIRVERRLTTLADNDVASTMIAITVMDNGRGMPHEVMSRAFEPFFTTKQFGSGTGLGLSTVYSFAQQSGGWATIDSTEGTGTSVTLFLPPALEMTPDDTPVHPSRRPTRALVVDDEGALADLVAGWLEDLGMETRVATTPDQAQHIAEAFQPELLVSDANLGSAIDGLELARILVERDPSLVVVFMTGFSERIRALQAAGVATLAKPFARDDLIACLTSHLGDRIAGPTRQEHRS